LTGILEISKYFCHDKQEEHDCEVEYGVAQGLVKLLRRAVSLYQHTDDDGDPLGDFRRSGLEYIASLSTSLAMVLHCSTSVLARHVQEFHSDLVPALRMIVQNFTSSHEDKMLVQLILMNVCKTIGLIYSYVPTEQIEDLITTLLLILNCQSFPSIQVDAAGKICALVSSVPVDDNGATITKLEANASLLISALSTVFGSVSGGTEEADPTLRLYDLAAISEVIRIKMMKRRCTMLAISRHFRHPDPKTRRKALSLCREYLDHPEVSNSFSTGMFVENALVETLAESAAKETDPEIQFTAVSLLRKITTMQVFPSASIMATIKDLAYSGHSDRVVVECGATYCEGMQKEPFPTKEDLSTVVGFTGFPFAEVRSKALATIESFITKSETVDLLIKETDLFINFGLIVTNGSDVDCEQALNIVRQLSRSSRNHPKLCENSDFLATVVDYVAKKEVSNRNAHFFAVEIVLALLSNDENTKVFLPFRHLLPWLVSFLNKTTADDAFKDQVVAVIIRLSTAYLEYD